ncbi:MAG: L-rhamnose isomerase [Treponema sp.]|jgi:L-rhamnose isomerase|nr:L-rhamnose isomerase [Treponema sp.]
MYSEAQKKYRELSVDTEEAMKKCASIPVALHCWQGDDVTGFENSGEALSGGIQATGNYPGKARNSAELMADLDFTFSLIPGKKRLNLHAVYGISGSPVERDKILPEHFDAWLEWAKKNNAGIDFNPTLFSHPKAADGFTLSHPDKDIRDFWIRHVKASRKISAYIGEKQGNPCLDNIWIPDGLKDIPGDRSGPRRRLMESLDEIFTEKYDSKYIVDSVESKFFGIGLESYTVGSHEFYIAYAAKRGIIPLLDNGHFHPSENVSDKVSALLLFFDRLALHVTRNVHWDSDHSVRLDDATRELAREIVFNGAERCLIGLDYFDASINRIAAWAGGARNFQKALLEALLLPRDEFKTLQDSGNYTKLLVLQEEFKTLPFGDVWEEYCRREKAPGAEWFDKVTVYEQEITGRRKG